MKINMSANAPLFLVVTILALLTGRPAVAQKQGSDDSPVKQMSLSEALSRMEETGFRPQIAETEVELLRSQYRQTNAVFLPRLSIEETGVSTNNPLNVFGSKLKEERITTADFNPSRLNNPDAVTHFTTAFKFQQAVINPDKWLMRSAAKKKLHAGREQLEATIHQSRFQVKDTYYRLLLAREKLEVVDKSLKAAEEHKKKARDLFEQGMISRADFLSAGVRLLELQSKRSRYADQWEAVQDQMKFLLNLDEKYTVLPTDRLRIPPVPLLEDDKLNNVDNSTLQSLQYRVEAAGKMLKSTKFHYLPSVNVFGTYELNDNVVFGGEGESYFVGATLQWNLFNGFDNAGKVMESKARLDQAKLAYDRRAYQDKIENRQAYRSINQAQRQFELADSTLVQATEDYRIRSNRYEQGMENTADLLSAEASLARARLKRLEAIYQMNTSLAKLEMLMEVEMKY